MSSALFRNRLDEYRAKLRKNIENELFMDQLDIECYCCYDTKPIEKFIHCEINHQVCMECVKKHAENIIFQNDSYKIKCINVAEQCECLYENSELEKVLDKKVFERYLRIKIKEETSYIFQMENINIKQCLNCETFWDIDPTEKILNCHNCHKSTCLECNEPEHKDRPCDKIRIKIEESLTQKNFLICPSCTRCIYKEDGCNAVRCPCGNNMCWGCKKSHGTVDAHGCNCASGVWGPVRQIDNELLKDKNNLEYANKLNNIGQPIPQNNNRPRNNILPNPLDYNYMANMYNQGVPLVMHK
jgi:TRIAD3 protein (E3 ubiquitin-protein ligase RNF216)